MSRDGDADRPFFSIEPTEATTPAELLDEIAAKIRAHADDYEYLLMIGVGQLESMFHHGYADEVWPEMERLAETEPAFLWTLGCVWASHPALNRLLWRLKHWRRFTLTAVLWNEPGERDDLSVRAPAVEGLDPALLPALLRRLADSIEENPRWLRVGITPDEGEIPPGPDR